VTDAVWLRSFRVLRFYERVLWSVSSFPSTHANFHWGNVGGRPSSSAAGNVVVETAGYFRRGHGRTLWLFGDIGKGKGSGFYCAILWAPHLQCAQVWITQFYLQIIPYLPLPRKRSPGGATTDCSDRHLIAAYYSLIDLERMKGWVGLVGWLQRTLYSHEWSSISCRSSAGQGKFAGQRPTFYHCATQSTIDGTKTVLLRSRN